MAQIAVLLDPVDRFPLRDFAGGVEEQDPLILMATAAGQHGGAAEQSDAGRKRKHSRAESSDSTGELNPDAALLNSSEQPGEMCRSAGLCAPILLAAAR